ncbi:MAG: Queuine tRNA-ribosyltransferase [Parcubacteria group bacterium GW2011_GWA2_36_10]|nr:MAG: Queuine tRNA-ribosyltransferase [Parcubacteria group bacterium GW2011_GWA2_36_10]
MFKLLKQSKKSLARLAILDTAHGKVSSPFFMPIATKAAIKSLTVEDVKSMGAEIILSNTYHNYLKPGLKILQKFGGLHDFMQSDLPILTDSGGYQVFSLANLRKIKGDNIEFQSHLDGSKHILNPKKVIDIQVALNSDIMMVLDECIGLPAKREDAVKALERTTRWAEQAFSYKEKLNKKSAKIKKQLLFGIVQGADFEDLRLRSADELTKLAFDGFAIGGLAVGETNEVMYKVLKYTAPVLPANKPRYLMGVGYPENIIEAVKLGVDMFDCVIPTREARHGKLYLPLGKTILNKGKLKYKTIQITNSQFFSDIKPINQTNLKNYSLSYLHHLFKTQEPLALKLATLNNLKFYLDLMKEIRQAIKKGEI